MLGAGEKALELCGGNAAFRSSANVEDVAGRTFSGYFKTVLNVRNHAEIEKVMHDIHMSLFHHDVLKEFATRDLSMGITVQSMIYEPEKAGVVYSEGYELQPIIPISWTNGLADKLLSGEEIGKCFIMMKAAVDAKTKDGVRFLPNMIDNENYELYWYDNRRGNTRGTSPLPKQLAKENTDLLNIAGFANALEEFFGHAVDVEFAIKDGVTYILQQRPYVMPRFKIKNFGEYCMSIYNPDHPVIKGKVLILDDEMDDRESGIVILKDDGITCIQKNHYKDIWYSFSADANAYNHIGNMKRENKDYSCLMFSSDLYSIDNVQTGDYIELNLETTEMKRWPVDELRKHIK